MPTLLSGIKAKFMACRHEYHWPKHKVIIKTGCEQVTDYDTLYLSLCKFPNSVEEHTAATKQWTVNYSIGKEIQNNPIVLCGFWIFKNLTWLQEHSPISIHTMPLLHDRLRTTVRNLSVYLHSISTYRSKVKMSRTCSHHWLAIWHKGNVLLWSFTFEKMEITVCNLQLRVDQTQLFYHTVSLGVWIVGNLFCDTLAT